MKDKKRFNFPSIKKDCAAVFRQRCNEHTFLQLLDTAPKIRHLTPLDDESFAAELVAFAEMVQRQWYELLTEQ